MCFRVLLTLPYHASGPEAPTRKSGGLFFGRFNKQDIRELCPTLSDSSIEGALRKLVAADELKKEGRGKNTCYFRLN